MAKATTTGAPSAKAAIPAQYERPAGTVLLDADAFNQATLQLDRARALIDLFFELAAAGLIENISSSYLTSALDGVHYFLGDAYEKLSAPAGGGHEREWL